MSRRTRARIAAFQALFQDDQNPEGAAAGTDDFLKQELRHPELISLAWEFVNGVRNRRTELDETLNQFTKNWTVDRMTPTDRNIVRLGAFEILFMLTPGPVAINEAVEIAKKFGTEESSQFVNGLLDRLHRDHVGDDSSPKSNAKEKRATPARRQSAKGLLKAPSRRKKAEAEETPDIETPDIETSDVETSDVQTSDVQTSETLDENEPGTSTPLDPEEQSVEPESDEPNESSSAQ